MSELPAAVGAGEPGLIGVGHEVVVETVLTSEGGLEIVKENGLVFICHYSQIPPFLHQIIL